MKRAALFVLLLTLASPAVADTIEVSGSVVWDEEAERFVFKAADDTVYQLQAEEGVLPRSLAPLRFLGERLLTLEGVAQKTDGLKGMATHTFVVSKGVNLEKKTVVGALRPGRKSMVTAGNHPVALYYHHGSGLARFVRDLIFNGRRLQMHGWTVAFEDATFMLVTEVHCWSTRTGDMHRVVTITRGGMPIVTIEGKLYRARYAHLRFQPPRPVRAQSGAGALLEGSSE